MSRFSLAQNLILRVGDLSAEELFFLLFRGTRAQGRCGMPTFVGSTYLQPAPRHAAYKPSYNAYDTMCGGQVTRLIKMDKATSPFPNKFKGEVTFVHHDDNPMEFNRKGIMTLNIPCATQHAELWREHVVRALEWAEEKYNVANETSFSWDCDIAKLPGTNTSSVIAILHYSNLTEHNAYVEGRYSSYCNWCDNPIPDRTEQCPRCEEDNDFFEFSDDEDQPGDRSEYSEVATRFVDRVLEAPSMRYFSCNMGGGAYGAYDVATCWRMSSYSPRRDNTFTSGREVVDAAIVRLGLRGASAPEPVHISSNLGEPSYDTADIIALFTHYKSYLEKKGIFILQPETIATNPREHYHWIDSLILYKK